MFQRSRKTLKLEAEVIYILPFAFKSFPSDRTITVKLCIFYMSGLILFRFLVTKFYYILI